MSLSIEHLGFSYGDHTVLQDISFCAEHGELISVLGPNGAGKSTLFRCILGLLTPSQGSIAIDGSGVHTMNPRQLARQIAYIPQSHNPVFNFSVLDMVLMGTAPHLKNFGSPGIKQVKQAEAVLDRLGIGHLKCRGYANLSGGERQLVLTARALVQQAKILIMDEPSASLDFGNRIRVMQTVKSLAGDGYTVIQSTHDPDQAYRYSDKILALRGGSVLAWGTPGEILCDSLVSALYGVEVEVCSMKEDRVRVCIPASDYK